jgi:trimethylamine--corrinoid protein Co-methyltransferase
MRFTLWTEEQCNMINNAALEILERTGVMIYESESLSLLEGAGCLVKDNLVKYPSALVSWAINSAPERIVLANTDGKRTIFLEGNRVSYGMSNDCPWFYDSYQKKIRPAVFSDVEHAAIVADTLDNIDFVGSLALASDVTMELTDLYHFKALRMHTKKPILGSALDANVLKAMIQMGIVSAGSEEEFRRNPNFAIYCEPTSPLVHSQNSLEKLLICAEYGVPVTYAPAPLAGGTGPATLAGSLALGIAECLSGLVIHQLKRKGSPFILSCLAGPLDMKTTIAPYGDPFVNLISVAVGAMGSYYKLPTYGMSGCTDACTNDLQASIEGTFSIFASALAGTNLVHDNGYTGNGMIGNLEYLIMLDEIIDMTKHYMKGIEINDDTVPLDLIDKVGPGGNYLLTDHTLKYFKQETWYSQYMNRKHFKRWLEEGGNSLGDKIHEKVLELLSQPGRNGISNKQINEIDRILLEEEERNKKTRKRLGR